MKTKGYSTFWTFPAQDFVQYVIITKVPHLEFSKFHKEVERGSGFSFCPETFSSWNPAHVDEQPPSLAGAAVAALMKSGEIRDSDGVSMFALISGVQTQHWGGGGGLPVFVSDNAEGRRFFLFLFWLQSWMGRTRREHHTRNLKRRFSSRAVTRESRGGGRKVHSTL